MQTHDQIVMANTPGDATEARQAIVDNLREVLRRKLGAGQAG